MAPVLLSLLPLLGWGFSDFGASRLSRKYHPALLNFVWGVVGGLPIIGAAFLINPPEISVLILLNFLGVSLLLQIGFLTLMRAFSAGTTGLSIVVSNAYAAVTAIFAVLVLGDSLNAVQVACITVILVTIAAIAYEPQSSRTKIRKIGPVSISSAYALVSMLAFGIGFALFDVVGTDSATWYQDSALFSISNMPLALGVYYVWGRHKMRDAYAAVKQDKLFIYASISAFLGTAGLFWAVAEADGGSVPVAISAASALVTSYFAYFFDKEHLRLVQRIGAFVIVACLILLTTQ